jgi:hypothetical protein
MDAELVQTGTDRIGKEAVLSTGRLRDAPCERTDDVTTTGD